MPEIKATIKDAVTGDTWEERFHATGDPEVWAMELISNFNHTLRPGEHPRELVRVQVLEDAPSTRPHEWSKTNMYTIVRGRQSYDTMKCKVCGVTGKRHGLSPEIKRDSQWRAKKYGVCGGKRL